MDRKRSNNSNQEQLEEKDEDRMMEANDQDNKMGKSKNDGNDGTNEMINEKMNDDKPKIVKASETQVSSYTSANSDNKLPMKNENMELLSVIVNQSIASMQPRNQLTTLSSTPLSSYKFGSVSKDLGSDFGLTPFYITDVVPQLFKFIALMNETQQVNIPDMMITRFTSTDVTEVVSKSIQLFNIATMTVRIQLNDNIGTLKVLDPNTLEFGSIKLNALVPSGLVNPQSGVNFVENKIFSVLTAFKGLNDLLIAMPKKIICLDATRGGYVAEELSHMPFYEGMAPHLYYSVFSNLPDWMRQYLNEQFKISPLQIGDINVDSYAGLKLTQYNKLVIDQYTAAVLRLNFDKLRNHTLTTDRLQQMILASMFKHDELEVGTLIDGADINLLYNYTDTEYRLALFHIMTSVSAKTDITNFLVSELTKTNRLGVSRIEDVWKGLQTGDVYSATFNSGWINSVNIGNTSTPYEMLVYETFSDFFNFQVNFGPLPNSLNAVTEILTIYAFIMLYPRISQRMIHRLGYRLTMLFNTMYPKIFTLYKLEYGDVRTEFGKNKYDAYGKELTITDSQVGYVYTIFTARELTSKSGPMSSQLNQFIALVNDLRTQVMPSLTKVHLEAKRRANYPYMYDDYETYASWNPIPYHDYYVSQQTELGLRLKNLILKADDLRKLYMLQNPSSSQVPRSFEAYYTSWINQLANIVSTAGSTYQLTCSMMQETLFNSPFYVGSLYNPQPNRFWHVPYEVGIGPLESSSLAALIIPSRILVPNFNTNVGITMALTVEGEYVRNLVIPAETINAIEQGQTRIRDDIGPLDGIECFKMMNKIVSQSRKYGYAMQVTQWMITPNDINNPFNSVVHELAEYLKMASWVPLARRIFEFFDVSFEEYFQHNIGHSAFIKDGRYLDRTLVLVDPSSSTPIKKQPLNSKFNRKFDYMIDIDMEKLNILTRPLLNDDSRIIYVHNDWYFGKMVVDELGPTQNSLAVHNWTDETTVNMDFILTRVLLKNGLAAQLTYKSDITGEQKTIILPYTSTNTPVLLIKMKTFHQIPHTFTRVIAKAIAAGKIIVRAEMMKLRVFIEDMKSRTEDYSVSHMTEDQVYDILSVPKGLILDWHFKTTVYATNFSSNTLVIPSYIQWFATEKPADKNIFLSTITNAIERQPQTILPSADELGYGPDPDGTKFTNNIEKINSNIINWNNSIPTVSTKLLNSIDFRIVPYYPQYTG